MDPRIASVFLLGILSGLPWVMIGSALTLWLKEAGLSRTDIGYAGLIFSVFAINFLWAPLLDKLSPRLSPRIGQRRSWILLCQAVIAAACCLIGLFTPEVSARAVVMVALIIAIASATQDVAIDAFRVDHFAPNETAHISAAAAATTAGWWTGYAGLGYLPLMLSDRGWSWPEAYLLLAGITAALAGLTLLSPDPKLQRLDRSRLQAEAYQRLTRVDRRRQHWMLALLASPWVLIVWAVVGAPGLSAAVKQHALYVPAVAATAALLIATALHSLGRIERAIRPNGVQHAGASTSVLAFLLDTVIAPLADFFQRNGVRFALALLAFIFLFKIGEAFLGRMSVVFYKEIGYSNTDIANYSKMLTWWVTIIAAIPCGLITARLGIIKGLFISGIFMAGSNLMLSAIALVGPNINLYIATVIVDGATSAWGTVAFVAFISMLCNRNFSATQYALMASLAAFGRTTLASFSGQIVDGLDGNWALFFVLTAAMITPSLVLLGLLKGKLRERYLQNEKTLTAQDSNDQG